MNQKEVVNTAARLMKQAEDKKKQEELSEKEVLELKEAANYIFGLPQGRIIARALMKFTGIYKVPKNTTNVIEMGAERGKEAVYLFFIKGLLDHKLIMDIEKRIEKKGVK